jgi:hypothetical protein
MAHSSPVQSGRSLYRSLVARCGPTVASAALSTVLACGVASAVVLAGHSAEAETAYESAYGFDRTWNAALRMVRVDMGCKITEKDDQSGYLMFEYRSTDGGKRISSGSMEFIKGKEADAPVRLVIQLPAMPRYHEQVMLDTLVKKMRAEYGEAPQPRPKQPPAPPPAPVGDAGAEKPAPDAGT